MTRDPDHTCSVHESMNRGMTHEEAIADLQAQQDAALIKYRWYCHAILDAADSPTGFDCHSHGLREHFGHPDFQLVVPLPPEMAHAILINLANAVKEGRRFEAGTAASGIIEGYDVGFAAATECGREVLRMIIPGPDGRLARGEITGGYEVQYEGTS
jgi:hypothetical protein